MPRIQKEMSEDEDELDQLDQPAPAQQAHARPLSQSGVDINSPRARRKTEAVNYNYRGRTVIAAPIYTGPLFAKSTNARPPPKSKAAPIKKLPIAKPKATKATKATKKAGGVASKFKRLGKGRFPADDEEDVDMLEDDNEEEEKEVVSKSKTKKGKGKATERDESQSEEDEAVEVIVKKKKKAVKFKGKKQREKSIELYENDENDDELISASPTPGAESPLTLSGLNQEEEMNELDISALLQDMGDEMEKAVEEEEGKEKVKGKNKNAIASTSNYRYLSPEPPAPPIVGAKSSGFLSLLENTKTQFAVLETHQNALNEYLKERKARSKEKDLKIKALEAKIRMVDAKEKGKDWSEEFKAMKEKLALSEEETRKERKEKEDALERLRAMEYVQVDEEVSQVDHDASEARAD